ncbi:hypothetical protein BDV28DRAFT_128956 [Aspergillus coremiiformis]|uniref:Secreted protein n=1 Tax=Aspergillus coremiiformis TaxID=138285 RepID=A0A5N6ZEZ9_9EURO|nr:hypothetical protein BDV28DRAFT_128956 [Aspergillus coremiiformis]
MAGGNLRIYLFLLSFTFVPDLSAAVPSIATILWIRSCLFNGSGSGAPDWMSGSRVTVWRPICMIRCVFGERDGDINRRW